MITNEAPYTQEMKPFYGVVEEVIDESFVRVRIFGIHPIDRTKVQTHQLPRALVLYPTTGGQVGGGAISHNIEVDSWVRGEFVDYPYCMQPVVTHVIQGSSYSMSSYKSQGGEFVGQGVADTGENPNVDETATTNIPGGSNREKAYNYVYAKLQAEGSSSDPHLHTSALIGVLLLETTNINPATVNSIGAWGICQWLDEGRRRSMFFEKYGKSKRLDHQLDYMWWELQNTERRAKGLWLRATNLPDAVAGFAAFERAEEYIKGRVIRSHPNFKKRLQFAYQTYNSQKFTGGSV